MLKKCFINSAYLILLFSFLVQPKWFEGEVTSIQKSTSTKFTKGTNYFSNNYSENEEEADDNDHPLICSNFLVEVGIVTSTNSISTEKTRFKNCIIRRFQERPIWLTLNKIIL